MKKKVKDSRVSTFIPKHDGKRPWKPEIKARYDQLVNTQEFSSLSLAPNEAVLGRNNTVVELRRLELLTSSMPLKRSPN